MGLLAVPVRVGVIVAVVVVLVIVAAAAGRAVVVMVMRMGVVVGMGMRFGMGMGVLVLMAVMMPMVMAVIVSVVMVVMVMIMAAAAIVAMVIGAALGLEGALDQRHGAALPADHLGENVIVLDIDGIRRDLGRGVAVADMPGDAHQSQRILGPDLKKTLRGGFDLHQPAIFQLHRIAIRQRCRLVEVEQDVEATIGFEREPAAISVVMVEGERIDHAVGLDRGLANDGGGALHDLEPVT